MGLVYAAVFGLITLASFVIFIIMLIKSFKQGGVLHGLLGLITFGLYTYIWGWIKSKELHLFKMMLVWTILWVASIVLPVFVGSAEVMKLLPMLNEMGVEAGIPPKELRANKVNTIVKKKVKTTKTAKKKKKPDTKKTADWNSQALALWKNGKFTNPQKAADYLGKAIQKNPDFSQAYNNRANAYRDLKQYTKAIQDYNTAIRLNPDFDKAYSNRGNIYYDQKNYPMAVRDYSKSISLNPVYKLAYLNRGITYQKMSQPNQACPDFKRACELGDCDGISWAKQSGFCK
jgi:predicted Zn-dependent protease